MARTVSLDPFATKDLLTIPDLDTNLFGLWSGFNLDPDLEAKHSKLGTHDEVKLVDLRPGSLYLFSEDVPLENLEPTPANLTATLEVEPRDAKQETDEEVEDIWKLDITLQPKRNITLKSWDHFLNPNHEEPPFTYVTEAPPAIFDGFLRTLEPKTPISLRYAKTGVLLNALFDMGLGRGSAFFGWSAEKDTFVDLVSDYSLSGLSKGYLQAVIRHFREIGQVSHQLRTFGDSRRGGDATKVAFVAAVTATFHAAESYLERQRPRVLSATHLRDMFETTTVLFNAIDRLRQVVEQSSQNQSASVMVACIDRICLERPEVDKIMRAIFARSVQPLLDRLANEFGLGYSSDIVDDGTVLDVASGLWPISIAEMMPSVKTSSAILEELRSANTGALTSQQQHRLRAVFSWDEILKIQTEAEEYECVNRKPPPRAPVDGATQPVIQDDIRNNANDRFGDPFAPEFDIFGPLEPQTHLHTEDILSADVEVLLSREKTGGETYGLSCHQAVELSILPLLTAQHRLLSYSILQVLFQNHNLIAHLDILSRFQLMSDGLFSTQLATALFDTNQLSGEGRGRGTAKIGLRVQNRDTWPPASSELRLVLMDTLSDSLATEKDATVSNSISFAIRDLNDEELNHCRDINSIYALDFIRLHYKPPTSALEYIITPEILDTYDLIFKHLLRLLRMKELTKFLLRQSCDRNHNRAVSPSTQSFLLQTNHFISTIAAYTNDTAIQLTFSTLSSLLHDIQHHLLNADYTATLSLAISPSHLRAHHESTLDSILHSLLLKERQAKMLNLLYDIFTIILRFAVQISSKDNTSTPHDEFARKVKRFVEMLATTTSSSTRFEGRENGTEGVEGADVTGTEGWDALEALRVRLDYNGFYTRGPSRTIGHGQKEK